MIVMNLLNALCVNRRTIWHISLDSQELQEPEPFPSEDLKGSSSEEEVSDSIDEFTSSDVDPTPHQRKRSAVKDSTIHKKSRTDENPP